MALFHVAPPPQLVWFQVYVAPKTDGARGKERFTTKLTTTTAATAALNVPSENHLAFLCFLSYSSYILTFGRLGSFASKSLGSEAPKWRVNNSYPSLGGRKTKTPSSVKAK